MASYFISFIYELSQDVGLVLFFQRFGQVHDLRSVQVVKNTSQNSKNSLFYPLLDLSVTHTEIDAREGGLFN